MKNIKPLFKEQEKNCYKSVRIGNFWNSIDIEYEINGGGNKNLLIKECLDKVKL